MAFVYKAERKLNEQQSGTSKLNNLGPGSYNEPPPAKGKST
jgi:hypothetical protein